MSRDSALMYVTDRSNDMAEVEVILGHGNDATGYVVEVIDQEPDDVWGPILSRALDEAMHEAGVVAGEYPWRVYDFHNVKARWPQDTIFEGEELVFEVEIRDEEF